MPQKQAQHIRYSSAEEQRLYIVFDGVITEQNKTKTWVSYVSMQKHKSGFMKKMTRQKFNLSNNGPSINFQEMKGKRVNTSTP